MIKKLNIFINKILIKYIIGWVIMATIEEYNENPLETLGKDIQMIDNDIIISANNDFSVIKFKNNLSQAIKNRLQTILNEMELHPEYGSKLSLLLGKPRDEILKSEIASEIRFTLMQEPRIQEILNVNIEYLADEKDTVKIKLEVLPIDTVVPMNMVYQLFL